MNDKAPYRKGVGVLLAILLPGSAHFLTGRRAEGVVWYFGLVACGIAGMVLLAIPGTVTYILGVAVGVASVVLWFVMLKQSYRPVRRIGFFGWLLVLIISVALGSVQKFVARQAICPFKVPTGTMQPTILGLHGQAMPTDDPDRPGWFELFLTGSRFHEFTASSDGTLSEVHIDPYVADQWRLYDVGTEAHRLPRCVEPLKQPGEHVAAGDTLWSGTITCGDRLFVERLSYRFRKPERGDIVVFRVHGVRGSPKNTFYIKRIAGLPGERLRIAPPFLIVNDQKVTEPAIFGVIASKANGYAGFQNAVGWPTNEITLGPDEYYVLGDNTLSSFDSRYWGPVPGKNIIGKATRIYWPLARINALEGK